MINKTTQNQPDNKKTINNNYIPDENEEYMNAKMLKHFQQILIKWQQQIYNDGALTISTLQDNRDIDNYEDSAVKDINMTLELRERDRQRKLLQKISNALKRIENNTYGWCEVTGKKIGVERLLARPIATLCLEAQQQHEQSEASSSHKLKR